MAMILFTKISLCAAIAGVLLVGAVPVAQTHENAAEDPPAVPRPVDGIAPGSPLLEDLSGTWSVRLDPGDRGLASRWFIKPLQGRPISLPGTTDEAGYGVPLDHQKMTYEGVDSGTLVAGFGQHPGQRLDEMGRLVREHYYVGPAWYERTVQIDDAWQHKQVVLRLERVIWESRLWLDGRFVGSCDSLVAEHRYDLGELAPGPHRITLRIDNRPIYPTGLIQHGYGEETQTRWNGVVGALELEARPAVWIERIAVFPAADRRSVTLRATIGNASGRERVGSLAATIYPDGRSMILGWQKVETTIPALRRSTLELTIPIDGDFELRAWDEFTPVRYALRASLRIENDAGELRHSVTERFGFRQIGRAGSDIEINGRKVFLRGLLDCAVYPLTGYAPMDLAGWTTVLDTVKSYGFNHVRFHTWCPPEAAFEAADRLGLYLASELAFWPPGGANGAPQLGQNDEVLAWARREIRRISEAYGNHPSFCFFCIGNEFAGGTDWAVVNEVLREAKVHDGRRLYSGSTARTRVAQDDFWVTHQVAGKGEARGLGPAHTDWDFHAAATDLPVISHETGQRPAFPDYDDLLPKFTGVLKPYNIELYQRLAQRAGMTGWIEEFARASALFALDQYKAEHEALLRTPGWDGYQLLQLNDFTGQGEALVGLLDPFWAPKPGITKAAVRAWNSPTVPLARFDSFVLRSDKTFEAGLEVAHYGSEDLEGATLRWSLLVDDAQGAWPLASGVFDDQHARAGTITQVGKIALSLGRGNSHIARGAQLQVQVGDSINTWRLWIYPPGGADTEEQVEGVHVTDRLDGEARSVLAAGQSVLLLAHGLVNEFSETTGYSSVYWSAKMFNWPGNNNLGVYPTPGHPALEDFPHDGHSDWHWHALTDNATALRFDALPAGVTPIIQAIPDFHDPRPLLHLFETCVGPARLVVCGYDLSSNLEERHVARWLRHCLLRYMASEAFAPSGSISPEQARLWLSGWERDPRQASWRISSCDSEETGPEDGRSRNVLDGDPRTIWHTEWAKRQPPHPHEITIDLGGVEKVSGLYYLPRQDGPNGRIARYRVLVEVVGTAEGAAGEWNVAAEGRFPNDHRLKTVRFQKTTASRYVRLVALSEINGNPWTSAAELCPIVEE